MMAGKNMLVEQEDEQSQRVHAVGVMRQKVDYGRAAVFDNLRPRLQHDL